MDNSSDTNLNINTNTNTSKIVDEAMKLIKNALDKACMRGSFSIDEAYCVKIALTTVENHLK